MLSMPAIVENCFSSGVATADAIVSGLAPGRLALTVIVGKVDRRQVADRQPPVRRDAEEQNPRHHEHRRDGPPNEQLGEVHVAASLPACAGRRRPAVRCSAPASRRRARSASDATVRRPRPARRPPAPCRSSSGHRPTRPTETGRTLATVVVPDDEHVVALLPGKHRARRHGDDVRTAPRARRSRARIRPATARSPDSANRALAVTRSRERVHRIVEKRQRPRLVDRAAVRRRPREQERVPCAYRRCTAGKSCCTTGNRTRIGRS